MLRPSLPGREFRVEQLRLIQEGCPGLHRVAAGPGGGQRHRTIAGRQMHTIQNGALPESTPGDRAREAELMDEIRWCTDHSFHGGDIDMLPLAALTLLQ